MLVIFIQISFSNNLFRKNISKYKYVHNIAITQVYISPCKQGPMTNYVSDVSNFIFQEFALKNKSSKYKLTSVELSNYNDDKVIAPSSDSLTTWTNSATQH